MYLASLILLALPYSIGNDNVERESRTERQEKPAYGGLQVIIVLDNLVESGTKQLHDFLSFFLLFFLCHFSNIEASNIHINS
jgi:hypothetical protein